MGAHSQDVDAEEVSVHGDGPDGLGAVDDQQHFAVLAGLPERAQVVPVS